MHPHILIATPTANGSVAINYMTSVLALTSMMQNRRISHQYIHLDAANVIKSRNYLSNYFLQKTQATHLLFLDADMRFRAETIFDMLAFDTDFIGCAYPKRQLDLVRLVSDAFETGRRNQALDPATLLARNFRYPLAVYDEDRSAPHDGRAEMVDGCVEVSKLGTGILLLRRSVFEQMIRKDAAPRYDSLGDPDLDLTDVYGFFDLVAPGGGRPLLSEDLSFCYRWTQNCGGRIWCKIDHEIGHVGPFMFNAIPAAGILHPQPTDR